MLSPFSFLFLKPQNGETSRFRAGALREGVSEENACFPFFFPPFSFPSLGLSINWR